MSLLNPETVRQYQKEERAMIANRIKVSRYRLKDLSDCMENERLSQTDKIDRLKHELAEHFKDESFLECESMGEILRTRLFILLYNNKDILAEGI